MIENINNEILYKNQIMNFYLILNYIQFAFRIFIQLNKNIRKDQFI